MDGRAKIPAKPESRSSSLQMAGTELKILGIFATNTMAGRPTGSSPSHLARSLIVPRLGQCATFSVAVLYSILTFCAEALGADILRMGTAKGINKGWVALHGLEHLEETLYPPA